MAADDLTALVDELFGRPAAEGLTLALVVTRAGEVILERYGTQPVNEFQPEIEVGPETVLPSWSMAKSITHAAVGLLVADGELDLLAPAAVPEWAGTEKEPITVLDLLEMRPGLQFVEVYEEREESNCIDMLFGDTGPSHAAYAAALPLVAPPGRVWNYSSGTTNIICRILGDIVSGGPGGSPADREAAMTAFLCERLFDPAGMASATPAFDEAGDFVGSSFVFATARDFARFGELYLHDGVVDGVRVLPEGWTDHARVEVAVDPETGLSYGRHWWGWRPDFSGGSTCRGFEGQRIAVVPERDLVLVHLGKTASSVAPLMDERLYRIVDRC